MQYIYENSKLTIMKVNSFRYEPFFKILNEIKQQILPKIDEITNYDTQQISFLKKIALQYFMMLEDVSLTDGLQISSRNQSIRKETEDLSDKILENFLQDRTTKEERKNILKQIIHVIVDQKSKEAKLMNNLNEVKKKLYHIKQSVTDSSVKFEENFDFYIQNKLKESLEVVFLYLQNPQNIDQYTTTYYYGNDKRSIESKVRNSLNQILNKTDSLDNDDVSNLARFVISKMEEEKHSKS
jgi:hypothetical protein